jgi:RNA polymerase sigma factor (sigma-70 family)
MTTLADWTREVRRSFTRMSRDEEAEASRNNLVERNMPLVLRMAEAFKGRGVAYEDLVQEGFIGLMRAAEKYEPARGNRFSTMAVPWVRQALQRAVANHGRVVRLPVHIQEKWRKLQAEEVRLHEELCREPTTDELAEASGFPAAKIEEMRKVCRRIYSLDMPVASEADDTFAAVLRQDGHEEKSILADEIQALRRAMGSLTDEEQRIIRLRYGIGAEPMRWRDIGREMGMSHEYCRLTCNRAIVRLREVLG